MDLGAFTAPRGIVIVGASNVPDKIGGRPLAFLLRAGFAGPIRGRAARGGHAYRGVGGRGCSAGCGADRRRGGAARTMREGAELAAALAQGLRMPGRRLGVVTTSGGVGVLAADYAEEAGLTLPPLPDTAAAVIRTALPMAGTGNPIDSSTGILSDFGRFETPVEAVQQGDAYDGLLLYLAHIGRNPAHWQGVLPAITAARARRPNMPVVLSMLAPEGPHQVMTEHGVPVFEDPADAVRLMGLLARVAPAASEASLPDDMPALPLRRLNEAEALAWLSAAGLPVPWMRLARDSDEAGRLAATAPGLLAVKIASPDILHKTDVGGVRLGVALADVAAVADRMLRSVAAHVPGARIDGVTLAEMVADGPDLILGTLAARFAALGHDIVLTARSLDGERMAEARKEVPQAAVLPVAEAAAGVDAIVLATQYPDAATVLGGLGDITGKIVIDTTNPLKPDLSGLSIGHETSAGEELQRAFPATRIVKAFNTTGFNIMAAPPAGALMLVAGNDAAARAAVLDLARAIGFDARDVGPIERARLLEPLAMLWITLAYRQGFGRDYAFGVLA